MKKKLFHNYTFHFDKNERKVLSTFCKQAVNQMAAEDKFRQDVNAFQSIMTKLNSGEEEIKLTKLEKTRLSIQLRENVKHLEKEMGRSWFIKKWFMKAMYNQYKNINSKHFSD